MNGGTSLLAWAKSLRSQGRSIPQTWWMPQKERAILALAGALFWISSLVQAAQKDAAGASIIAFYGLGLLYLVCSLANVTSGVKRALRHYKNDAGLEEQPRVLVQLFAILWGMFVLNTAVLAVYLYRGVTITSLDIASIAAALVVFGILIWQYGLGQVFIHPFARGFLAMTFKAFPQLLLAYLFISKPSVAHAFTIWSLIGLSAMAGLRFWPSFLAYKRDTKSAPLRGLMLGESGNVASVLCMVLAWSWATAFA